MRLTMPRDQLLLAGVTALTLFGLLMVYSASMAVGAQKGEPSYFFVRQFLYAGIGYLAMIVLMLIDYHIWLKPKVFVPLAAIVVLCLMLVFTRQTVNGSHRSLGLVPLVSFQPSEAAKLVFLFYLAYFLHKHRDQIFRPGRRMIECLTVVALFGVLIGLEPDLGQAVCIFSITAILFFVAGLNWKYIGSTVLVSLPLFYFFVWNVSFRRRRIYDWLNALADPLSAHYQIKHAAIALGSGGLLGVGLGESVQKFFFLPEAQSDFIYSIIGEEFGLAGTLLIGCAFLGYLYLGIKISANAPDAGGFYLGLGITVMIALQALINISTAVSIMPTKGLTLPFISQGGSSLVVCLMASGILLNIASDKHMKNIPAAFPIVPESAER